MDSRARALLSMVYGTGTIERTRQFCLVSSPDYQELRLIAKGKVWGRDYG